MRDPKLIESFKAVIDEAPPEGRQKEQVVQDFLEANTELIPTPNRLNHQLHFKSVISKFPLGTGLVTDYAYLTKSSDTWRITLVELESPEKDLYTRGTQKVHKTAQFTSAIDQVRSWKQYLETHRALVEESLNPLLKPTNMRKNPIEYQFQLVIGRSANKNLTEGRKRDFRALQQETGIFVMTYDQLVSWYEEDLVFKKNVLRLTGSAFAFKSMKAGPLNMLSFLGPGELVLSNEEISNLDSLGYDMKAWQRGELLSFNGQWTREDFAKSVFDISLVSGPGSDL